MDNLELLMTLFPGFISVSIVHFSIKKTDIKADLLGIFSFAFINNIIIAWLVESSNPNIIRACSVILAILLAFLFIFILSRPDIQKLIRWSRSNYLLTSWDYAWKKMSINKKTDEEFQIICEIKLKSKERIWGVFVKGSNISLSHNKDGIYLPYILNDKRTSIDKNCLGILILHTEIEYVKFFKNEKDKK